MKKILVLIFGCLVLAGMAFAAPTPCPTGAYTLYLVASFTCTEGNLTFSAFGYSGTGNTWRCDSRRFHYRNTATDGGEGNRGKAVLHGDL